MCSLLCEGMGHALGDGDAGSLKRRHLVGVVGHQAHGFVAQQRKHFGGDAIKTFVGLEAQALIGLDRIEALILQAIGAQLVDEADAAAFLREIKQDAAACLARWRRSRRATVRRNRI